jgi:phospholipid/cholesterol/gamma-HCH transport system substrate-binding protein
MARRPTRDLTVGAVFALALLIVALAVMAVGGDSGLWFKRYHYVVVFPDATGLLVGAPVRMAGVQVGTVTDVHLPTDVEHSGIEVELGVDPAYAERVRTDSRAALRILQFLTNEKYVELVPGSPSNPALEDGGVIPRLVEVGVVERGEAIADDLGEITVSLKSILGSLERGEGLLGQALKDPQFGKQGIEDLGATLNNLNRITADLAEGRGPLGRLLHDEQLAAKLDGLASTIDDFSTVVRAFANREGALGQLLEEDGPAEQALVDLAQAAASLKQLSAGLEDDEGLLGRLLTDSEYSAEIAADLQSVLGDIAEITDKINSGEGSLGALINDRSLYDGTQDIVVGVNDSKFARWLTRRYRKKGIRSREREAPATPQPEPPSEGP